MKNHRHETRANLTQVRKRLQLKSNGELEPIMIAGGGGGLGSGQFKDDGLQHGRGPIPGGRFLPPSYDNAEGTGKRRYVDEES